MMFPVEDPILIFTILTLVIFAAPLLAERWHIPDLVLLLAAGALIGPNGLNIMERSPAIILFGSIGLIYIMFIAGLEIDLNRFMRTRNRSVAFGLLTFFIPMVLGTAAGLYLLDFSWPVSILMASLFASHTLLAYPIASRFGISRTEPVIITVGGTIITDTMALLVLAIIVDSAKGADMGVGFWVSLVTGIAGLMALITLGVPRLTKWFFQNVTESGGAQFLFVLGVVCGCAYLSHYAKMEPIIGAFLVGAVFNRLIPEQSTLMNRLMFVGNTLFIPFFLISVGMLVNVEALVASPRGWLVAGVMVAAVVVSKYIAAWITRKVFGYGVEAGRVIFGLSVIQAAATLAAVIVGYDLKIFDEYVLNGAIVMILVTCPLGAWMVQRYGRSLAGETEPRAERVSSAQRILVSIVNPDFSLRLLDLSFLLRDTSKNGSIYPVTIASDMDDIDDSVARGEKLLTNCIAAGASADIEVVPSVRVDLNPSDGLVRASQELRATQVLAGWSDRRAHIFGTVSTNLLNSCPVRLLFCHLNRPVNLTKRLLLPFPLLSERRTDLRALLQDARRLTAQIGAHLRVYIVGDEKHILRKEVESARPSCPLTIITAETWTKLQTVFLEDMSEDDMVLMPCERHDGILWTPVLDKLQEKLCADFPDINLLSAYPPFPDHQEDVRELEATVMEGPRIYPVDIPGDMECEEALRLMTGGVFGDNPATLEDVNVLLLKAMNSYPLEMTSKIVLLHAHSERVSEPVIIIGHGQRHWEFRNLKGSFNILLVLVSPKSAPSEQHLKILAGLARRFLDTALAEKVRQAASAGEICALLK
jgi:Kef-type K+ transport system membrane component KefB/mannitol/fructose-specific phosphotransferase system IIA component (Ntr-type)